jgi:phenylacetic acid degradation operon negative regulatory protein
LRPGDDEQRYREFIADFRRKSAGDTLASLVALVHAWRRFPMIDPALPSELLPTRWMGVRAAQHFYRKHARWVKAASAEWSDLMG